MDDAINNDLAEITAYAAGDIIDQADLGNSPVAAKVKDAAVEYADTRSSDLVDMLTDSTREDIQSIIADGIENGLDTDTIASNIMDATSFSEDRAALIAETETTTAVNMGMIEGLRGMQEDSGVPATKEWSCEGNACEICQENQDAGPIPIDEDFPSGDSAPSAHPNCVIGSTLTIPCGFISGGTKRFYDGILVILTTTSGNKLSITPNHPVLTPNGWVRSGELNSGSKIFTASGSKGAPIADMNNNNMPTSIEKILDTLGGSGEMSTSKVPVSAPDFHGDGKGSDIAVIYSNGVLRDGVNSNHLSKPILDEANIVSSSGICSSHFSSVDDALFSSSNGSVSGGSNSLPFGGVSSVTPSNNGGLSLISGGNSCGDQSFSNGSSINPEFLGQSKFGDTAPIVPDDFINWQVDTLTHVELIPFKGFVFNLETSKGYYIASNVIVHNCACDLIGGVDDSGDSSDAPVED